MTDRHVTWPNLLKLISAGSPARIGIPGDPRAEVLLEPGGTSLALLVQTTPEGTAPPSSLESVQVDKTLIDGTHYIRIATRARPLFQEFYTLLTEIADSIQLEHTPPLQAIEQRLASWKELLRAISTLSLEHQLGLLGELWLLQRLIDDRGTSALDAWTGPHGEPHDFRMTGVELEVKSTRNRQRIHIINGLDQLLPSTGQQLHILSLQFEPAVTDDSYSLRQVVSQLRARLEHDNARRKAFDSLLQDGCGYRDAHEQHYEARFRLRSIPVLVRVDDKCPRLTHGALRQAIGEAHEKRVADVRYTLNLEGLGTEDGSPDFLAIIPISAVAKSTPS